MFDAIAQLFTAIIYQPFLNILVLFYWATSWFMSPPNMGIAVIALTLVIRFLLLPLSLASDRSEKERRELMAKIAALKEKYSGEPTIFEREKKKVMRSNKRIFFSEFFNLLIQIIVILMLIRLFRTGLSGEDIHLIYSWMPNVALPFNMEFARNISLSEPSLILVFFQSLLLLVFEALIMLYSAYAVSRKEVIRLQFLLPALTFIAFVILRLPAGKSLFVITSLCFSIGLVFAKQIFRAWRKYVLKKEKEEVEDKEEQVVVSVK